jgi:alpha-ketoglutarate-dependent taurine dioxygenase
VQSPETALGEGSYLDAVPLHTNKSSEMMGNGDLVGNLQISQSITKEVAVTSAGISSLSGESVSTGHLRSGSPLPLVIEPTAIGVDLIDWAGRNRAFLEEQLLHVGAILFRNFDLSSTEEFEELIETASGKLLDYSYRSTPRTLVSGRIYTSTEYPSHQSIPLHNEHSYSCSWPMKLWFFSMQVAEQQGETPIADSRKIYQHIPVEIRNCFERKGLMYVRNYGTGLDLDWEDVFQTKSRQEVEDYCRAEAIEFEWIGDDQLRTRQRCQVSMKHPQTGEMVWFNQAHLFHISRLPSEVREALLSTFAEEDLPRNVYFEDGTAIEPEMVDEILKVYEQHAVSFPWHAGDVLLIDNMLAAHGRNPFKGKRRVVVGMSQENAQAGSVC